MRKRKLFAALILLLLWLLFRPVGEVDYVNHVGKMLGLRLTNGQIVDSIIEERGPQGDGATYIALQFPEDISEDLTGEYWHDLPMSENVSTVFYGREEEHTTYGPLLDKGLRDGTYSVEPVLPEVTNGRWYFYDRYSEAADPASDAWLYSRHSWNFTAAVYDADIQTLYYFALDT